MKILFLLSIFLSGCAPAFAESYEVTISTISAEDVDIVQKYIEGDAEFTSKRISVNKATELEILSEQKLYFAKRIQLLQDQLAAVIEKIQALENAQ